MKRYAILMLAAFLGVSCNSQEKNRKKLDEDKKIENDIPKGSWEVNKEFDEAGNLIRYDSIYSWSSGNDLKDLALQDRDSVLKSLKSRFYSSFSGFNFENPEFENLFQEDSLFTNQFFKDDFFSNDFGKDFMDIDHMRERMEAIQKQFIDKYRLEIDIPKEKETQNQKRI
ncbi:hypothetical protein [Aquimarina sp. SS2-1]|uniref:hypothetical protein n=1 Tax=Aquimarina besae TaxID=3342247 RepID=UPI00366F2188